MRKPTPKYANVTATLALFVALGGTSYAAATISSADVQNGSLRSVDIKNESLKSQDVDNGSLTGSDVKNGSIKSSDVDNASLLAADFKPGELPAGPQGPQGVQGPQGPAGATNVVARRTNRNLAPPPSGDVTIESALASCLPGERAVGGGAGITNITSGFALMIMSEPAEDDGTPPEDGEVATRWRAVGVNSDVSNSQTMNVHVLCASP
jgi:hypothetical protein